MEDLWTAIDPSAASPDPPPPDGKKSAWPAVAVSSFLLGQSLKRAGEPQVLCSSTLFFVFVFLSAGEEPQARGRAACA